MKRSTPQRSRPRNSAETPLVTKGAPQSRASSTKSTEKLGRDRAPLLPGNIGLILNEVDRETRPRRSCCRPGLQGFGVLNEVDRETRPRHRWGSGLCVRYVRPQRSRPRNSAETADPVGTLTTVDRPQRSRPRNSAETMSPCESRFPKTLAPQRSRPRNSAETTSSPHGVRGSLVLNEVDRETRPRPVVGGRPSTNSTTAPQRSRPRNSAETNLIGASAFRSRSVLNEVDRETRPRPDSPPRSAQHGRSSTKSTEKLGRDVQDLSEGEPSAGPQRSRPRNSAETDKSRPASRMRWLPQRSRPRNSAETAW